VFHTTTIEGTESSCNRALKVQTVNEQVAVLPEASVAVQVTVVQPMAKVEPEGGTHMVVTPGQLSEAVGGGKQTTVPVPPAVGVTATTLDGQVIVGGWVSLTLTVKVQLDVRAISTDMARISLPPPICPTSVAVPVIRLIVYSEDVFPADVKLA
jgi:hypothetical protein